MEKKYRSAKDAVEDMEIVYTIDAHTDDSNIEHIVDTIALEVVRGAKKSTCKAIRKLLFSIRHDFRDNNGKPGDDDDPGDGYGHYGYDKNGMSYAVYNDDEE